MSPQVSFHSGFGPDLKKTELESIKSRKWRIDCPFMRVQSRKSQDPATYEGPGLIRLSEDGRILFRQYATSEENTEEWDFRSPFQAGQIIPDRAFYDLKVADSSGREGVSERFIPDTHRTASGDIIISGNLTEIVCDGSYSREMSLSGAGLNYWLFHDVDFPENAITVRRESIARGRLRSKSGSWNAWKFRSQRMGFLVVQRAEDELTIRVNSSDSPLNTSFPRRIIEAFQFVLGNPLQWTVMKYRTGHDVRLVVRSTKAPLKSSRFQPPLPPSPLRRPDKNKRTSEYHRRLFNRYLKAILYDSAHRSSIWGLLNAIHESSTTSFLDAEALTLTVAIESLLHNEFEHIGGLSEDELSALGDLRAHADLWEGNESLKRRIQGFLVNIPDPRAVDRMRELANKELISEDQWQAWQKLRNISTHAYQAAKINPHDFIDLVQTCQVLFYHLVFISIGYQGPYMDVSSPGWPVRKFPENTLWG